MTLAQFVFTAKLAMVRRPVQTYYAELRDNESLSRSELEGLQRQRARAIASFANGASPYYRNLFRTHGIDPARTDDPDQWQRIPVSTRSDVKAHASEIRTPEASDRTARIGKTSGSTGQPLQTLHDNRVPNIALAWRMYRWWGIEPWDNLARAGRWGFGKKEELKNRISWWPSRQVYLDAMLFDDTAMRAFHTAIRDTKPRFLEGYVGAMVEFADFLRANELTIPGVRAVATTAAPLTSSVRGHLTRTFDAPVYDEYRGSEVNWLAGECSAASGMHIFSDARIIEILDDDGQPVAPGAQGNVAVTDLTNRVFPVIRYLNGDRGSLRTGPCSCGLPFPLMDNPAGRATDVVRTPSGKSINHGISGLFAPAADAVKLFQLHQAADFSIRLLIVPSEQETARDDIERIVEGLRARLDHEVPVEIEYVTELPSARGKLQYIFSEAVPGSRPTD